MTGYGYFQSHSTYAHHSHYTSNSRHPVKNFGDATVFVGCSLSSSRDLDGPLTESFDPLPPFSVLTR